MRNMSKVVVVARRVAAGAVLAAFVALFAGLGGKWLACIARLEFWPAVLSCGAMAAALLALTLLAGRWYCSVLCPLGILQDLAFVLRRRKAQKACGKTQAVVRCAFLAVFLGLGFAGLGWSWLEPYGIFGRICTTAAGALLGAAIVALGVWRGRVWCNWVCPVGTLLGALSRFAPFRLRIEPSKCVGCRKCERGCRAAAIKIAGRGEGGSIDATKCVQCRDCTAACPVGAIAARPVPAAPAAKDAKGTSPAAEGGMTRRAFLAGAGAATAVFAAEAAEDKIFDGGFAPVSLPGIDRRNASLKPAGSHSIKNFKTKCVGCQLCVRECPNHVLRPSLRLGDFGQPEMAFDKGYCTPDCTRCAEVCPAGAIEPLTAAAKANVHIGGAVWHAERCLAATEGVNCTACYRHCPAKAIERVANRDGYLIPVVDADKCVGCGACEHVCPSRPMPAMTVEAYEVHREFKPMAEEDALAEALALVEKGAKACVAVKDGVIAASAEGRGIKPLLSLLDREDGVLRGAVVVDKVIGRAAAAICIQGGAARVHAVLMSEDAAALLAAHGVKASANSTVERIMNREQNGFCPMELASEGLEDPAAIVKAVRARAAELAG